jgi:hypothetical protein
MLRKAIFAIKTIAYVAAGRVGAYPRVAAVGTSIGVAKGDGPASIDSAPSPQGVG